MILMFRNCFDWRESKLLQNYVNNSTFFKPFMDLNKNYEEYEPQPLQMPSTSEIPITER